MLMFFYTKASVTRVACFAAAAACTGFITGKSQVIGMRANRVPCSHNRRNACTDNCQCVYGH